MAPKSDVGVWMKLYVSDFKDGTGHMSAAEVGAYWRLLMHGWQHGGIPAKPPRMARITGMGLTEFEDAWREVLAEKFQPHPDDPGLLVNAKQERVRASQSEVLAQRRAAARAGAEARWRHAKRDAVRHRIQDSGEMQGSGAQGLKGSGAYRDQGESEGGPAADAAPPRRRRRLSAAQVEGLSEGLPRTGVEALLEWRAYREEAKVRALTESGWRKLVKDCASDPAGFRAKVDHSIQNGYQGLFAPKETGRSNGRALTEEENLALIREAMRENGIEDG